MDIKPEIFSLLLVDNDVSVLKIIKHIFATEDYCIYTAQGGQEALDLMQKTRIDAALIDFNMPEMDGLSLLENIKNKHPLVMTMMLTGYGGVEEAVKAIKLGAVDFIVKPPSVEGLRARMAQIHEIWKLRRENRALRRKAEFPFNFDRMVGNSTAVLNLKRIIAQISPGNAPILIQGETGSGKELVAQAIHFHSERSKGSFVPVDCAAISETVIENELFGHEKGAFTGAHTDTLGLIRSADKGTLFLDEIGELAVPMQAKLLRTLQEGEVRPVGSSRSSKVDVRVIAATNLDLSDAVSKKTFRQDLYYRLNVVTLYVPPLRERRDDIRLLARIFIERHGSEHSPVKEISAQALACLEAYDWPGNIRELENIIRRAMALSKTERILPEDLPQEIYSQPADRESANLPLDDSLDAYERAAILNALEKCGNNRRIAAKVLGIGEATLYRKLKKHRIQF